MHDQLHDLKAMRLAARVSAETMAARLGVAVDTFTDLEDGKLMPSNDLLEEWQRAAGLALCQAARHRRSASRPLRRWFIRLG
jgi:transcriptional regulator with XRE-family HTH domain